MTKSFPHDASHEPAEIVRPRSASPIRVAFASRPVLKRADFDEPPLPLSGTSIIQTAAENWEPIWKLIRPCCRTVCGGRRFRRFVHCLGRRGVWRPWGRPVMRTSWIICSAQLRQRRIGRCAVGRVCRVCRQWGSGVLSDSPGATGSLPARVFDPSTPHWQQVASGTRCTEHEPTETVIVVICTLRFREEIYIFPKYPYGPLKVKAPGICTILDLLTEFFLLFRVIPGIFDSQNDL